MAEHHASDGDPDAPRDRARDPLHRRDRGQQSGFESLVRGSPHEVLARLVDGDPLELDARCRARLRERALLLCVRRLHLRSVARIAHAAKRYRGELPVDEWIGGRIDYSIGELIDEDREDERSGVPPSRLGDARYAFLSETLGVEPGLARRACVGFNSLADDVRSTYFAIVVDRKTIRRYVAEGHGPPDRVRSQLSLALRTLGKAIGRPRLGEEGDPDHAE